MMTTSAVCDRCGNATQHLFPDSKSVSRICSNCYEALRLHQQGVVLSTVGMAAMVLGAVILLAIVVLLLTQ